MVFGKDAARKAPKPNRLTTVYQTMQKTCPDQMRSYALCVMTKHSAGNLERDACATEFMVVKQCWRKSLLSNRKK